MSTPNQAVSAIQVTPATLDDCRAVAEVHVESWQHAYRDILPAEYLASLSVEQRAALWRETVATQSARVLVARSHGAIVGFVACGASRDAGAPRDRGEIWAIYVKPTGWSSGIGRELWLAARRQLQAQGFKRVSLWVIVGNQRAIDFYARAGFIEEPASRQSFELGGTRLEEVRYVFQIEA